MECPRCGCTLFTEEYMSNACGPCLEKELDRLRWLRFLMGINLTPWRKAGKPESRDSSH